MPSCQAINCTNTRGKCQKSFFEIPDPLKSTEKRRLCKLWIDHLRNEKLNIDSFVWSKSRVVCEDHFEENCFETSPAIAKSLGFKVKPILKEGAIPTIVKSGLGIDRQGKERKSSQASLEKRKKAQLKESLTARGKPEECAVSSKQQQPSTSTGTKRKSSESKTKATKPKQFRATHTSTPDSPQQRIAEDIFDVTGVQECVAVPNNFQEILPCGHPCEICRRIQGFDSLTVQDHSYSKSKSYEESFIHVSTTNSSVVQIHTNLISSTPVKVDMKTSTEVLCSPVKSDYDTGNLDQSYVDDLKDIDYIPIVESDQTDSEDEIEPSYQYTQEQIYIKENKYIVFESAIEQLLLKLKCDVCDCPVDPDDICKDLSDGSVVTFSIFCTSGHLIIKWRSQPFIGKMPVGNLLISAATLYCGQTYSHISQFADFLNLKFISHTTYNKIQRECLMPVVKHTWSLLQEVELKKIREQGRPLRLAGDGRCDSPGFSAKYCTYSLLDIETQHIVMFVVIKVTETGSSSKMEVLGFRKCLLFLLDQGFSIEVLATDRHVQIRSIMNKEFSQIQHQFDVWHLCKSVKKKLTAKAKVKGCEDINFWIKSICNHLWWCASNCGGDKNLLEESWISIVQHIVNVHTFDGKYFTQCAHAPIQQDVAEAKRWLAKDSKAHKALKEIILDKRLRKDIRQLNEFCHTGNLEVFHSLLLKYTPKRQEFDADQMWTRTALAVIDHNLNQNRDQKVNKDGEKAYKLVCPKATGQWVVKPIFKDKSYQWVFAMMENVLIQKDTLVLPVKERQYEGNIAPLPAPSKTDLIENFCSRFKVS